MRIEPSKVHFLLSPRIVALITTLNSRQGVNAAPVDFISPISFNPPIIMVSIKPIIHTYKNIVTNKEFVINILGNEQIDRVLRCAAVYQEGVNKLELVGLHWYSSERVRVPRVKEAKAWIECKLFDEKRIGDHISVFGLVVIAEVIDSVVTDSEVDMEKVNPILHIIKDRFAVGFKVAKHKRYD